MYMNIHIKLKSFKKHYPHHVQYIYKLSNPYCALLFLLVCDLLLVQKKKKKIESHWIFYSLF